MDRWTKTFYLLVTSYCEHSNGSKICCLCLSLYDTQGVWRGIDFGREICSGIAREGDLFGDIILDVLVVLPFDSCDYISKYTVGLDMI